MYVLNEGQGVGEWQRKCVGYTVYLRWLPNTHLLHSSFHVGTFVAHLFRVVAHLIDCTFVDHLIDGCGGRRVNRSSSKLFVGTAEGLGEPNRGGTMCHRVAPVTSAIRRVNS